MSNTKVVTVTLNPSLDRTLIVQFLAVGYHNRTVETTQLDPAGQGVNVARALHQMGEKVHALVLLGNDATAKAYEALISHEGFPVEISIVQGPTRSNIFIVDKGNKTETTIKEDSAGVLDVDLNGIAAILKRMTNPGDTVVFAGSFPNGAPDDLYVSLAKSVREAGSKLAIGYTETELIASAIEAKTDLLTLTQNQAEAHFNFPVRNIEDVIYCARELQKVSEGEVVISLRDNNGLVVTTPAHTYQIQFPEFDTEVSEAGSMAALIAGVLSVYLDPEYDIEKSIKMGAASMLYTSSQVGNTFGTLAEIKSYFEHLSITKVDN